MTKVLILGVSGFTGKHLVRHLRQLDDARVFGVDVGADSPAGVDLDDYIQVDVSYQTHVEKLVKATKPSCVFHLVGITRGEPEDIYRVNFLSGLWLMQALKNYAPNAGVLLVGSAAEYGLVEEGELPVTEKLACKPLTHYAASKCALTSAGMAFARQDRLRIAIARPFNIIGPGMPVGLLLGDLIRRAGKAIGGRGEPVVKVGNLDSVRDFIDVNDAVDAYIRMLQGSVWGEVLHICSGRPVSVRELVNCVVSWAPRTVRIEIDPELIRPAEVSVIYGSYNKARAAFGFEPRVSLEESVRAAWAHETRLADAR